MDLSTLKRFRQLSLLFVGTLSLTSLLWIYCLHRECFCVYHIRYNEFGSPVIEAKIGDKKYPLVVRVGSKYPFFLSLDDLEQIEKQPQVSIKWNALNGKKETVLSYLIPKIIFGSKEIQNIIAIQAPNGYFSTIGNYLGQEENLLLDFPHSQIVACSSFSLLKTKKRIKDQWIQASFDVAYPGIVFSVKTDLGVLKLAIDTTLEENLLRSSLIKEKKFFTSTSFCVGNREYRSVSFSVVDMPDFLEDIDGFIGMNFLKNHAMYIDYANKTAYLEPPSVCWESFPVSFNECQIPFIDVQIENHTYSLELDLGSSFFVTLKKEILENIEKTSHGTALWFDFRGKEYASPFYKIPKMFIGGLPYWDVLVKQDREDFHENTAINHKPLPIDGVIGRPFLDKYNLFLDFKHSTVYVCDSLSTLQQKKLISKNLLVIPFVLHQDGILLSLETEHGSYQLLLDTGATLTAIRAPCPANVSQFRLVDHDFGRYFILPIELCDSLDYDGCLGMDFLLEYSIFIDYVNKKIFLDLDGFEPEVED